MSIINRRFSDNKDDVMEHSGCKCRNRGVPEDYPDGKVPNNWTPDEDYQDKSRYTDNVDKTTPKTECQPEKRHLIEDLTFLDVVNLLNMLVKENNNLKLRIERLENGQ